MLERWPTGIGGVRDGYYIPMGPEMLPENGIVGFADLSALGVEVGHLGRLHEVGTLHSQ